MNSYVNEVKDQLKDWKLATLVLVFTIARVVYGWAWMKSGIGKLAWLSDGKLNSVGKIQTMITNIAGPEVSRFDPLMINKIFAAISENIFLGMPGLTDALVVVFEIGVGLAMILGFKVFWAALVALFMNTQFIAGGSFNNFGYIWTNIAVMNFVKQTELLGLSGYLQFNGINIFNSMQPKVNQDMAIQTSK
ncbi:MAG: DoxX family protein [Clostridiaceae bacterium BRH_c20a]|nr:MAG: DoxX family protein [Clostridiaceae bacterium BRH_c20a]